MSDNILYGLGREFSKFDDRYADTKKVFASELLDEKVIKRPRYEHCTFINISFKMAKIQDGHFLNCMFIGCYFRRTEISNTNFTGCKFVECDFRHVALNSNSFKYCSFKQSVIPFSEMQYNLPTQPNLEEELARNLSLEATKLGLQDEAGKYRLTEIDAHEAHLWAGVRGDSDWYRKHFPFPRNLFALGQLLISKLNKLFWGYGESSLVLVRNLMVAVVVLFPALFWVLRFELQTKANAVPSLIDILYFSVGNIVPLGVFPQLNTLGHGVRIVAGVESLFGLITIGFLASCLFKWSLRR